MTCSLQKCQNESLLTKWISQLSCVIILQKRIRKNKTKKMGGQKKQKGETTKTAYLLGVDPVKITSPSAITGWEGLRDGSIYRRCPPKKARSTHAYVAELLFLSTQQHTCRLKYQNRLNLMRSRLRLRSRLPLFAKVAEKGQDCLFSGSAFQSLIGTAVSAGNLHQ